MPLTSAGSWLAGPDMLFTGSRHRDRQRSGRAMIPLTDPGRREMALVLGVGVRRAASIVASATVLLLILGCGANPDSGTETPSAQSPSGSQAPSTPSEFNGTFNVNGHDLLLACTGNGEPTMILEAGEAVPSDAMGCRPRGIRLGPARVLLRPGEPGPERLRTHSADGR
jgi:hypothetical protein